MKIRSLNIVIFISMVNFTSQIAIAQNKKKAIDNSPITAEKTFSVTNTSKSRIFNYLLKSELKLVNKKQSIIVKSDSLKGELIVKRLLYFDYKVDTVFNGKVIKNSVNRKEPYQGNIVFNVGDNMYSYKLSNYTTTKGEILRHNDKKYPTLSSCAESQFWTLNDGMIAESILMKMK